MVGGEHLGSGKGKHTPGLKPAVVVGFDVRGKALTYPRNKSNGRTTREADSSASLLNDKQKDRQRQQPKKWAGAEVAAHFHLRCCVGWSRQMSAANTLARL